MTLYMIIITNIRYNEIVKTNCTCDDDNDNDTHNVSKRKIAWELLKKKKKQYTYNNIDVREIL